ncbi:TadE/TadG family type IV pilus assembly protein [Vibrio lentus]|uniref:Pilus assembly protein CpaE n=1 Tax=Vibrio lentus TaxID=136468 RepID=A0AB36XNP6_9VIBR|nr:TadE/TadG family type IV pilus assembly protein [Vibrio lentus]MCC4839358.1 pilus assembly protein [Vibrio lentus]PMI14995.1 pilus assembly protein CpaE [Vibrio lentus]PMK37360.1 pilus assembly protein CpaE [Vibrio lentus]PMK46827.1 pilus assembly protein CpaE [Vibrio lentus]PML33494.1 pilus assembly protein CpaE [Vibrio lentus]
MMIRLKRRIKGLAIVEFTLVSSLIFLLLFLILALGAYIFSLQMVSEATRKAARLATVCYVLDRDNIAGMVVDDIPLVGFTNANLEVAYLDASGVEIASDFEANFGDIKFVRARATGYGIQLISNLSFLGNSGFLAAPAFETILPAESLGVVRPETETSTNIWNRCP